MMYLRKHNSCLDIPPSIKAYIQRLKVWQDIQKLPELSHTGSTSVASLPPQRPPIFMATKKTPASRNV